MDFDYETYLLIVGNKTIEDSGLNSLLEEANFIVDDLDGLTASDENKVRLRSAKKYISNLETYKSRVEENLDHDDKYEDNINIWENDIQIVTSLLTDTISQYLYYEIREMNDTHIEYQEFYKKMIKIIFVSFVCVSVIVTLLSFYISQSIAKPVKELSDVTKQVAKGDFTVRTGIANDTELGVLGESLNVMIDKINELLQQVTTEQIRLRKAELELLQSQINPHFLYNTLDTIIWLAEGGDQKMVVSMVSSLSDFFRTSLNQGRDFVCIKEEIKHVRSYLEIQQVRYQDILEYEINISEELEQYIIPKITIQPLVENALYHGIKNKRGVGKIIVEGKLYDKNIYLYVRDNGIGMSEDRLAKVNARINNIELNEKGIFGLYNVNERIRLRFGEEYGINIESKYNEGTSVIIKLPCEVNEKNEPE